MDLEQPHSVPAAFGSSTPPCNPTSGSPASSADDSTILSKTPPAQNRKSPSSTLVRNLVPSPRGVKRKSSLTQQGNSAPIGTSPDASSSGFGPPSKSSFISNPAANTAFSGPQFNNGAAEYSMHSNFGPQYNPQNSNQNNVEPPRMSEMTSFHSPVTLNNQFGAPNHLQQHTTVRLFSTSMLNRAESFISRGQCAHLSSFHANEANSVKFINPIEDDKMKLNIKMEAQQKYSTNKANTAIANMKALTDSIPTPRSWQHHSPGNAGLSPATTNAVSTVPPGQLIGTNANMPPGNNVGDVSNQGAQNQPTSQANGTLHTNIKQEAESCRTNGSSGANTQMPTSQNNSQSNLSQDLLSKRAMKTEYLKTLKKSLLDDEMNMNDCKPNIQGQMHPMNPAAMHHHQRMMHPMMGHPPPGAPPGMIAPMGGGNQTANAVAMAAANRAAAIRQDLMRQQQQQQQHNHANCVQGMCMHQMSGPRELHPAARQMIAMGHHPSAIPGGPSPYLPPGTPPHLAAQMHANPALRMNPAMHPHMVPKCRPGCNINHVHNVMGMAGHPGAPGPGGGIFMPPGMGPMYSQNTRTGAHMMFSPPNGVQEPGINPGQQTIPGQGPGLSGMTHGTNTPMNMNSAQPGRPMMPFIPGNGMPGGLGSSAEGANSNQVPGGQQYPGGVPTSMASFQQQQRMPVPQPQQQQPTGNNSMINVIMTIGSGNGNSPGMNNMSNQQPPAMPSSSQVPNMSNNYQMQQAPNNNPMMMMNNPMPMKQEPNQSNVNSQGPSPQQPYTGMGNPGMFNGAGPPHQDMPSHMPGPNSQYSSQMPYQQNFANEPGANSDFYSVKQVQSDSTAGSNQSLDPNMMSQQQQGGYDMDELGYHNMMSGGGDQRQISVNVDKNRFMVQSNLNGAQFNVQGSALPQGPNLRTNVAVNMQVQSNRYPSTAMTNTSMPSQMNQYNKYGPGFDPAGQGMPPSAPNSNNTHQQQMWNQHMESNGMHTASQPTQIHRAPNFEMYSSLSDFKPISDTPKGTVEYLPDGKTREKSKDNPDFPSSNNPAAPISHGIHMQGGPDMMPSSQQNMMMAGGGPDGQPGGIGQNPMMMAPGGGPMYDPRNTFNEFQFSSM